MKYALGNMLNGAGGLNADQLALDLQFAADKTLTARKGPTPNFTRASSGTFVGSNGLIQSAGNNVARFDHDPVTLASRGLLIEESRTNVWSRSEELSTTPWTAIATTTFAVNDHTAPDGQLTAERIIVGATTQTYGTGNNQITFATGTTYTASCFFKANQITRVAIQSGNTAILPAVAIFDLTGSGSVVGTPTGTASIQQFANGWYRCSVTGTAVANGITSVRFCAISGTSFSYPGNGVDSFYAWGAQMELASFPTSYIPTTTASVVRSADVCSITGAAFSGFYNQPEGTLFADVTPQAVDQLALVLGVNTTTFNNSNLIYKVNPAVTAAGRRWVGQTNSGGLVSATIVTPTDIATTRSRLAYGYKLNDFAFAHAGGIVGTDTSGTVPASTAMRIGSRDDGLAINGHLAAVRYYRLRLSNAKLQALTV